MNKFNQIVKRIFDFLVSLIGIIILSPIFVIVSIAIKLDSRGEVLFLQKELEDMEKNLIYISLGLW